MAQGLNLAGKTYEVYQREKGRWLLAGQHTVRSAAMDAAEELLESARNEGVRVVSENTRTGEEEVIFEQLREVGDKALTIVPVDSAPLCNNLDEFLSAPARRTAGRLMHNYLADQGITALELAFDYGRLRMLERMDKLFPSAMQRIGTVQARAGDEKPHARVDVLYRLYSQLKDVAQSLADAASADAAVLRQQGLAALAKGLEAGGGEAKQREQRLLAAIAAALRTTGGLLGRIDVLVEAYRSADSTALRDVVDGVLSEVMDRPDTISELLAAPAEPAQAAQALAQLAIGQCSYRPTSETLEGLDAILQGDGLEATREVLLARVTRILGSTRPLTRSGERADREAFESMLGDLTRPGGLGGGPDMAMAVLSRVRHLYRPSPDADDLDFKEALQRLLSYMPAHAVRIGVLLDLLGSPDCEGARAQAVVQTLGRLVQRLDGPADLVPPGARSDAVDAAIADIRRRLETDKIPDSWRAMFTETLERLAAQTSGAPAPAAAPAAKSDDSNGRGTVTTARAAGMPRRAVPRGKVIFEEATRGEEAYLIADGKVEVYRNVGGKEMVLATLGKGQIFGEMSLIDDSPRMASARTVGDCQLIAISRDDLRGRLEWLANNDRVLRRLIDVFVARLRSDAGG